MVHFLSGFAKYKYRPDEIIDEALVETKHDKRPVRRCNVKRIMCKANCIFMKYLDIIRHINFVSPY